MLLRLLLAWLAMPLIAIANGTVREYLFKRWLPTEASAFQLSTGTLILLLGLYAYLIMPWLWLKTARDSWAAGVLWLLLTVGFETSFGLVAGKPMAELVDAYNVTNGNLWALIPLWTLLAPVVMYLWRR